MTTICSDDLRNDWHSVVETLVSDGSPVYRSTVAHITTQNAADSKQMEDEGCNVQEKVTRREPTLYEDLWLCSRAPRLETFCHCGTRL